MEKPGLFSRQRIEQKKVEAAAKGHLTHCRFCRKRLKRGAFGVTRAQVCHHCGKDQVTGE